MLLFYLFLIITVTSIFLAIKKQKTVLLSVPIAALITYAVVEIALVPAPFLDTIKFIFSLK
ncbi:hypothetical protein LG307_20635 [Sutcliffiella horikoshii]|uniref:hypothetical protein n=1 Tax=Sutcliffiella horikoshii TaxID=79883 RepID=UPI00384AC412